MPRSVVVVPRVLREPSDTRERVREPRPSERHLRERVHDNGRNDGREWTYVASNRTTSAVDTTHYQSGRGTGRGADRGRGERGLDRRRENERMREAR
jgi:hypothetical protein